MIIHWEGENKMQQSVLNGQGFGIRGDNHGINRNICTKCKAGKIYFLSIFLAGTLYYFWHATHSLNQPWSQVTQTFTHPKLEKADMLTSC